MLLLFKDFQIEFHQRAEGETIFSCRDREKINNQIALVLRDRKRVNEQVCGQAFVPSIAKISCSFVNGLLKQEYRFSQIKLLAEAYL